MSSQRTLAAPLREIRGHRYSGVDRCSDDLALRADTPTGDARTNAYPWCTTVVAAFLTVSTIAWVAGGVARRFVDARTWRSELVCSCIFIVGSSTVRLGLHTAAPALSGATRVLTWGVLVTLYVVAGSANMAVALRTGSASDVLRVGLLLLASPPATTALP